MNDRPQRYSDRHPMNKSEAMKRQESSHINRISSKSDGAPAKSTSAGSGKFVIEPFEYDGRRQVTVYVPPDPSEAWIFAGDGQRIAKWSRLLEKADVPRTMIVGVHGPIAVFL